MFEFITDQLTRYYFMREWYDEVRGIVEYIAEWSHQAFKGVSTERVGLVSLIVILFVIIVVKVDKVMSKPRADDKGKWFFWKH